MARDSPAASDLRYRLFFMKIILLIIFSTTFISAQSQADSTRQLADSGKAEFLYQVKLDTPGFEKAERILRNQLKLDPANAELHYYYGYVLDRINALDGKGMPSVKIGLALKASEQFELVNKLEPTYKHDLYLLDPYSKITAIWGSLAQSFFLKGQIDSARWAFRQGKNRGGYIEPILEFNRQLLSTCKKNSILLTNGDNITFPIWYLQEIEKFRPDITPVDVNLINTKWYPKYLIQSKGIKSGLTNLMIDTLDYLEWKSQNITIKDRNDSTKVLSWELKPTYMNAYILKGDIFLLDLLKQNFYSRPFYFSNYSDSTYNLYLTDHLIDQGLVSSISVTRVDNMKDTLFINPNLASYSLPKTKINDIAKSQDAVTTLSMLRWAYYSNISHLIQLEKYDLARKLLEEMQRKFPWQKLPFSSPDEEKYFQGMKDMLKNR